MKSVVERRRRQSRNERSIPALDRQIQHNLSSLPENVPRVAVVLPHRFRRVGEKLVLCVEGQPVVITL
jgi:hypothetical protein